MTTFVTIDVVAIVILLLPHTVQTRAYSEKMKLEEGKLATNIKETLKEILGESDMREFTQNILSVKFDDKTYDFESKDISVQVRNVENTIFNRMRYRLYDVPGKSLIAKKVNEMLWPTSMKQVTVPSAVVRISTDKERTQLPNSSLSLRAGRAISKIHVLRFSATNTISTASVIMRSSGAMWMARAPKSPEKSFSNYNHFVFDGYLMKIEEENATEKLLRENTEFRKIIRNSSRQNDQGQEKKFSEQNILDKTMKEGRSFIHSLLERMEPNEATHNDISEEEECAVAVRVDKDDDIEDDSLFGILRVYCSSP